MPNIPFIPELLPLSREHDKWGEYNHLVGNAGVSLGKFDGLFAAAHTAPFGLMWLLQESQYSNEIEGTITNIEEVLENHAGLPISRGSVENVLEVKNYCETMQLGANLLEDKQSFSLFFIRQLHNRLLEGRRGATKNPGSFRTVQVHIGPPGSSLEEATYIPPPPHLVPSLMDNLQEFISRTDISPLIQAAVMHAQFEMIHPFMDGNGRLGRLLISLILKEKNILSTPTFYISAYLQAHRRTYYDALKGISQHNNWANWIEFFLRAIIERSKDTQIFYHNINKLYESLKASLPQFTTSRFGIFVLDYIFKFPIFTQPLMAGKLQINSQTLSPILRKLESNGFIAKVSQGKGRSATTWHFVPLIDLMSHRDLKQT